MINSAKSKMEDSRGMEKEEEVSEKEIWRRYEGCKMRTKRSAGSALVRFVKYWECSS